jgi:diadenosine tetraphosphate (Ap4A) HIT family hydrolase
MNLDYGWTNMTTLLDAQKSGRAPWDNKIKDTPLVAVFLDRYPCTEGHRLYVPKDDNANWIVRAMEQALADGNHMVAHGECDGFNIGYNSGPVAGQTVMYPHIHLIPRRAGDVEDPVGGVRNTIPGKGNYKNDH